jgi:hypothetical protein
MLDQHRLDHHAASALAEEREMFSGCGMAPNQASNIGKNTEEKVSGVLNALPGVAARHNGRDLV